MNYHYSKRQVILRKTKNIFLGIKPYTIFTVCPLFPKCLFHVYSYKFYILQQTHHRQKVVIFKKKTYHCGFKLNSILNIVVKYEVIILYDYSKNINTQKSMHKLLKFTWSNFQQKKVEKFLLKNLPVNKVSK